MYISIALPSPNYYAIIMAIKVMEAYLQLVAAQCQQVTQIK